MLIIVFYIFAWFPHCLCYLVLSWPKNTKILWRVRFFIFSFIFHFYSNWASFGFKIARAELHILSLRFQEIAPHSQNIEYVRQSVMTFFQNQPSGSQGPALTNNDIIDCITAPEIVNKIANRLLAKKGDSANNNVSPFIVPSVRTCRCECCGPVCIRVSMMSKKPMRSISVPVGQEHITEAFQDGTEEPVPKKKKKKSWSSLLCSSLLAESPM